MNLKRYVIEAKDEHGWFDYSILSREEDAVRLARDLMEGFGSDLSVIDLQNMIEVEFRK